MYLHLGDDCCAAAADILAILDSGIYPEGQRDLPAGEEHEEGVRTRREPRSVVVTERAVYRSVISAQSLKKRMETSAYRDFLHDFKVESKVCKVCIEDGGMAADGEGEGK